MEDSPKFKLSNGDIKIQKPDGSVVIICGLIPLEAADPCNGQEVNLVAQCHRRREPVENIDRSTLENSTTKLI